MIRRSTANSVVVLFVLALVVGACGRKDGLQPPEGEKSVYTGLGTYPAPDSVVPQEDEPPDEPGAQSGEEGAGSP